LASQFISNSLVKKANVLTCGNGGSFSDASHFAGELVNNFTTKHIAYSVLTLGSNQAVATAWSNDNEYESQFAREFQAFASAESTLIVFSTSGKSKNVINVLDYANRLGVKSIGFTSIVGEKFLKDKCDVLFVSPTESTPKAQEVHIILYHALAKAVEDLMRERKSS
jgi:D-sedoheptulose 7-phosphate isomerase